MLPLLIQDLTEVDEAYHGLYEKSNEGYMLQLDDATYKKKLDEFRTNNRTLFNKSKNVEELQERLAQFEGVDPEKLPEALKALEAMRKLEEEGLIKDGRLDEVIDRRLDAAQRAFDRQLEQLQSQIGDRDQKIQHLTGLLTSEKVDNSAVAAVNSIASIAEGARSDVLGRARGVWSLDDDGNMVAIADGAPLYGADGKALTIGEWAASLVEEAPHLFMPAKGGGGGRGGDERPSAGRPGQVDRTNPIEMGRNLEAIAKGESKAV